MTKYADNPAYQDVRHCWDALEAKDALITSQAAEIERLREALFVADDTIMTLHGCFPMDRATPEQDRLHRAAKLIRAHTSEDYYERKRIAERVLPRLPFAPATTGAAHAS